MRDYIMDMRNALTRLSESYEEMFGLSASYGKEIQDIVNDVSKHPNKKTFKYEQEHYENVYYEDIMEGDRLYLFECDDGYMMSAHFWVEIEITHKYGGILFYKVINPPTDGEKWTEERHLAKGSVAYLMNLMPKKVVINNDYHFTCTCPYTEFITDENMDNKYTSIFENTEARRY